MSLSDPFESTEQTAYQGRMAGQEAAMGGVGTIASTIADVKQKKNAFNFMKQLGVIKQEPISKEDLSKNLISFGQKYGTKVNIPPDADEKTLIAIHKAMNIPLPKPAISVQPGFGINEKGEMSYTAQKPEKTVAQTVAEFQEAQQLLGTKKSGTDQQAVPTVDSKGNIKISSPSGGGFGAAYVKVARETADAIADGVKQGDMAGFMTAQPVAKEIAFKQLHDEGINVQQGIQDYTGIMQLTKTMNQNQMVNLNMAFDTIQNDMEPMRKVSANLERTGFKPANNIIVKAELNGVSLSPDIPPDQVEAATKYVTQINVMRDTMAVAFQRGGTPTEQALKLTDNILNPAYSNNQIDAALDQIQINLNMRKGALPGRAYIPGRQQNTAQSTLGAAGMGRQTQQLSDDDALKRIQSLIGGQ